MIHFESIEELGPASSLEQSESMRQLRERVAAMTDDEVREFWARLRRFAEEP